MENLEFFHQDIKPRHRESWELGRLGVGTYIMGAGLREILAQRRGIWGAFGNPRGIRFAWSRTF